MIIELDYSGHGPRKFVEASQAEVEEIKRLTAKKFLFDTDEGRALLLELELRPQVSIPVVMTVVAYQ